MNYSVRMSLGFDSKASIVYTLLYLLIIHKRLRESLPHIYIKGRLCSSRTEFILVIFYPIFGWIMFTLIVLLLYFFTE